MDLNRNFPDAFSRPEGEGGEREAEVRAVMDWLASESFVLSANLHGGAVVASYPYDNSNGGQDTHATRTCTHTYLHSLTHLHTCLGLTPA